MKEIDQSIISLISNPAGKMEQNAAYDKQIQLMEDRSRSEPNDLRTLRELSGGVTPDTDEQRFYDTGFEPDVSLQPNMQTPIQPNVRNDLAFGTLDDALNTQMLNRGIGTL